VSHLTARPPEPPPRAPVVPWCDEAQPIEDSSCSHRVTPGRPAAGIPPF